MPYGPKGQWRPADPVAAGVHIGKLMVGEEEEVYGRPKTRRAKSGPLPAPPDGSIPRRRIIAAAEVQPKAKGKQ